MVLFQMNYRCERLLSPSVDTDTPESRYNDDDDTGLALVWRHLLVLRGHQTDSFINNPEGGAGGSVRDVVLLLSPLHHDSCLYLSRSNNKTVDDVLLITSSCLLRSLRQSSLHRLSLPTDTTYYSVIWTLWPVHKLTCRTCVEVKPSFVWEIQIVKN